MNKYEQLIEHIINDDEAKARALFHDIVVEKSREIYESLMDEEYTEEDIHSANPVEDMMGEIQADETNGIGEGGDEDEGELDMDLGDADGEEGMDDMDHMDHMGGEEDLESKVMDLESELEALKAEFEALMGDEAGEEEHHDGMDDPDFGDEEMGHEEMPMAEAAEDDEEDDDEEMTESAEDDEEDDEEEMTESVQRKAMPRTAVDLMREYVEKISAPSNTEFTPVGTGAGGDKAAGNTKNPLAGKNDMGGTTQNIARGGTGADTSPDGNSPKWKPDGKLVKNPQEIDVAKRNVNKPGGNKGAQDWYNTKASAKKGEGQTTDGSVPVQKKSIEPGGN
jgi:hypothetical protein